MIRITIKGLQEAQAANAKAIAAVKPEGGLGRAVLYAATEAHRMAISYTHVDTGALRASHRIRQEQPARFSIHIDPNAKNPRSGTATSVYGPYEHARGSSHAFYEQTYKNRDAIMRRALVYLNSQLP